MTIKKRIFFGIPYFNDENALISTFSVLSSIDLKMRELDIYEHSFVFYDDGSDLNQSNSLANFLKNDFRIRDSCLLLGSEINRGYGYACAKIKQEALDNEVDFLLILDSELSMAIEDIFGALEIWEKNETVFEGREMALLVKPSRFLSPTGLEELNGSRKIWSKAGNLFARVTIGGCSDPTNGFRGLNHTSLKLMGKINFSENGFAYIVEEMYWATKFRIKILESNTTYKVRSENVRKTSFIYSKEVLTSYMKHCFAALTLRVSRIK
jgi:hypothetical protein